VAKRLLGSDHGLSQDEVTSLHCRNGQRTPCASFAMKRTPHCSRPIQFVGRTNGYTGQSVLQVAFCATRRGILCHTIRAN
jgi:hypothetical protein